MKNENILTYLQQIIYRLPEEDQKTVDCLMKTNDRFSHLGSIPAIITDMIKDVQDDMKTEAAKRSGRGAAKKAAEKILYQIDTKVKSTGGFIKDGLQYIGGIYSVVCLPEPLPVIEYPAEQLPPDYQRIMLINKQANTVDLDLPTYAELAAYIKSKKAMHKGEKNYKPVWEFGEKLPCVNAVFLLELYDILGECSAKISRRNLENSSIYLTGEHGEGMLCAVFRKRYVKNH